MKKLEKISLLALLASGLAVMLSFPVAAQDAGQQKNFDGQVSSYDQSAQTLTVGGQTYQILPTSRITDTNAPSSAGALANGEKIEGTYKDSAEGKHEVITLNITERSAVGSAADTATSESGATFQGRVDRIDRNAQTFTINGQTYQILPTTRISSKGGATAQLSNLNRNQQVEGAYKMSAEGKREVLNLEIAPGHAASTAAQGNAAAESGGTAFHGSVDRVDATAQTFTINNQTYQILPTTRITGSQGTPAAASNVSHNQRVSGTYKMSAEGKREVVTLDIGGSSPNRNQ